MSESKIYRCGCGEIIRERCEWTGPISEMVIVEYMPESIRSSHVAAGNSGIYPHNGSIRVACCKACAELVCDGEGEWAEIIDPQKPEKYADEIDQEIEAIKESLRGNEHGIDFAVGSRSEKAIKEKAEEWRDNGFTAAQVSDWLNAGCFDANSAEQLRDAGLRPDQVTGECTDYPSESWGYAFANSDADIDTVIEACQQ